MQNTRDTHTQRDTNKHRDTEERSRDHPWRILYRGSREDRQGRWISRVTGDFPPLRRTSKVNSGIIAVIIKRPREAKRNRGDVAVPGGGTRGGGDGAGARLKFLFRRRRAAASTRERRRRRRRRGLD